MSKKPQPDPVVDAYKAGIDRTLLRENLKLTPAQRIARAQEQLKAYEALRDAGRRAGLRRD